MELVITSCPKDLWLDMVSFLIIFDISDGFVYGKIFEVGFRIRLISGKQNY